MALECQITVRDDIQSEDKNGVLHPFLRFLYILGSDYSCQ